MFIVDPKQYGIHEKCRLCIKDMVRGSFRTKKILEKDEIFSEPFSLFSNHMNYHFKIQLLKNGEWKDYIKYTRILPEYTTKDGLHYLFYPCRKSRFLSIGFQAINTKPFYNYIKPLQGLPVHRLYIRDWMGGDELTHSSYYLGPNKTLTIADACQRLITEYCEKYHIEPENTIFLGSSKGGYAALYHGLAFGAGHIVVGSPQTRLAAFLVHEQQKENFHNRIFEWLFGPITAENKAYADALLFNHAEKFARPYQKVSIMVGRHEEHYAEHVFPFQQAFKDRMDVNVVLGEYREHSDTATHYPPFLRETVAGIVGSQNMESAEEHTEQLILPVFSYEILQKVFMISELYNVCEKILIAG